MTREMLLKLRESALSVLPVSAVVLALHFTLTPMPVWTLFMFLAGVALLILGMGLFTMGADLAMMPIGDAIGADLTRSRKLWLIVGSAFVLGVAVTVAEPDLQLLTKQVPAVPDAALVAAVALGVGVFLTLALTRILFRIHLAWALIGSFTLVFLVGWMAAPDYLAVAFDSGGVTTGPITVPFILALGGGVSAVRGGKSSEEDSFGLCGLCSVGPILAVLILGMFFDPKVSDFRFSVGAVSSLRGALNTIGHGLVEFFQDVFFVILPVVLIFLLFQVTRLRLPARRLIRILVGLVYTLAGLSIFLAGANLGFMPAGMAIANMLATHNRWALVPLGALIGFFMVFAEPAVHVLNRQVEDITSGAIPRRMMLAGLSVGVGIASAMSVIRVLTGVSIWWFLLPGYILALTLTFFTPKLFVSIAFDSGGVASGTMTAAFLLPFTVGVCDALGGNPMTDAFGAVGMVAMMPLITVQMMGVVYQHKLSRVQALERNERLSETPELGEAEETDTPGAVSPEQNAVFDVEPDLAGVPQPDAVAANEPDAPASAKPDADVLEAQGIREAGGAEEVAACDAAAGEAPDATSAARATDPEYEEK